MSWNDYQSACKEAFTTEAVSCSTNAKIASKYLTSVEKKESDTLKDIIKNSYKKYKNETGS